jgi:hypothetical protein
MTIDDRFKHIYIPGKSGYGKSSLMALIALQDIEQGFGITVLDPKGDTTARILNWIPDHRKDDVYYISGETAVPIDLLSYRSPDERSNIAQEVMVIFERMMTLGDRMGPVLEYAINTVMQMRERCFLDIYHFLEKDDDTYDLAYRQANPTLQRFWGGRYTESYFKNAELPLTTRMTSFILIPTLEKLLGNRQAPLNIPEIVESGKILLVNLHSLGSVAGYIAGCLITSQIQQTIFRRQPLPKHKRLPYFLFADEFQDFKNQAFNKIVQQARGFHLGLTLANQHPKQVAELWDDIKGCVSTYYMFQMDESHAQLLKSQIRPYKPEDLRNVPIGTCLNHTPDGETQFIDVNFVPEENPDSPAGYIKDRMIELIKQHPPTARQGTEKHAESVEEHPRVRSGNSQPKPSQRPFSRPRNPK